MEAVHSVEYIHKNDAGSSFTSSFLIGKVIREGKGVDDFTEEVGRGICDNNK